MKTRPGIHRVFPLLGIGLTLLVASAASSQTVYTDTTAAKLRTTVHLRSGASTLPTVLEALSQQTGLHIKAQPCLQERKIVVQMDRISAREVLDTFSELYGWRWTEIDNEGVLLMRPRPKSPQTVAEISEAAQAALPVDIRRFLGIGVPESALPAPIDTQTKETIEFRKNSPLPSAKDEIVKMLTNPRIKMIAENKVKSLYNSLALGDEASKPIYYTQLTQPQRDTLLTALTLDALMKFNGTGFRLLHGTISPDLLDTSAEEIFLHNGNGLFVGKSSIYQKGLLFQGGAGTIKSLPRIESRHPSPPP
jgi:hypothetical protein